jgi:hypothetical protein
MSRGRWLSGLVVFVGFAASGCVFRSADSAADGHGADAQARIDRGLAIAPVPLKFQEKDRALVGLGSYIVNAQSACNDCHTAPLYAPGHDPFKGGDGQINAAGYLKGGKLGDLEAPDLTPDARGLPGGLTLEKFARAMNDGEDPGDPSKILQVMPWPIYRHMTAGDQRAVYEYLRAIPSSHPNP